MADWPAKRAAAFTVTFPIYDNDGDLVTAAAALDSEVDIDAAGFNDATNEATEVGTSGVYKLLLTAAEMTGDIISTITKTTTTNAKTGVNVMYTATRQLLDLAFPTVSGRSIDVDAAFGVEVGSFQAGAITAAAFTAGAIDAAAIANAAIDAATFAAGAIDAAAIANGAIDAATFAAGAIDAAAIASNAIDADALAADVTTELRALVTGTSDAGGTTTTLVDAALTQADDVFNGAWVLFTSGAVANQARLVTDFDSATDTVTFAPAATASIGAGITYEILPNAGIDVRSWIGLVTGLVTPNALISGRVDANVGALQNDVITAASIATAAIDADAIAADAIGASEIANGAIDAATFAAGAIDAAAIANGAIDAATFAAGAIDAAAIANAAIDAATFAAGAIDAAAIATDAIGAAELAADAVNEIADGIFTRASSNWEATAPVKSLGTAVMKAVHRIRDNAGTLEIYRSNGTTIHASQTITVDAALDPIDELTGAV